MKKLLLGTTLLAGLAGPALATGYNTIAIDDDSGSVGSLSITQSAPGTLGNTVNANGTAGSNSALAISGPWTSVVIAQSGAGTGSTLKGTTIHSTTAGTLAVNQNTTGAGTNIHTLNIGSIGTPPNAPSVMVYVKNINADGSTAGAADNTIIDTLNGSSLSYNLGLQGENNSVTNNVSAGTGGVTMTYGSSGYGLNSGNYGIAGSGNTIANTLTSANGTVNASLKLNGSGNSLTNAVTTTGGNITLTQGGGGYGIVGANNTIDNEIGQGGSAVLSFGQTLLVSGNLNHITNTVTGSGDNTVNQSVTGDSNTVTSTVSGGGLQTANVTITGSNVKYAITSAASASYADVSLLSMGGTLGTPDIVRVEQTGFASSASATLTVNGGGVTMGVLGSVPGTYSAAGAGVAVYQNTSGAYLSASVTASANGYKAIFTQ